MRSLLPGCDARAVPAAALDIRELLGMAGAMDMMRCGGAFVAAWLSGKAPWFRKRLLELLPGFRVGEGSASRLVSAIRAARDGWRREISRGAEGPLEQGSMVSHTQGPDAIVRWTDSDLRALNESGWTGPLVALIERGVCTPLECEAAVAASGKAVIMG